MGMRLVWGLRDTYTDTLVCLLEAENLLDAYREMLLRRWYDEVTAPLPARDYLPGVDDFQRELDEAYNEERQAMLSQSYDFWRNNQTYGDDRRYVTEKYELWNSVPPNVERLVVHFDS